MPNKQQAKDNAKATNARAAMYDGRQIRGENVAQKAV